MLEEKPGGLWQEFQHKGKHLHRANRALKYHVPEENNIISTTKAQKINFFQIFFES